jgi:alkanesulfonate monooxygenase SsuD/methylene tetrahydromethanopterin reductase-like flavin-dependent oxidoreductase (luciferase family)
MTVRDHIATDLVLSPFEAKGYELLEAVRCAEDSGFDGVWTLDHFSGTFAKKKWSHEPFTLLGAFAAKTSQIRLGPLVANMVNRHPVLLASAISTLQSLTDGRAVVGLGTGATPGSRFAQEQDAIRRTLSDSEDRCQHLIEVISALRVLWDGGQVFKGKFVFFEGLTGVVEKREPPPLIVGANSSRMMELALNHADGVNIRVSSRVHELLKVAREGRDGRKFEISIHENFDLDHPTGGDTEVWITEGVDRRALTVVAPFDLKKISEIGKRLSM